MAEQKIDQYIDTSAELTFETIKKRTVQGIIALSGRTVILQVIALVATFYLTVFLDPNQYGVFFVVSSVINFFAYFSDVGLAAALIQKKDSLTDQELKTTFTIQQFLVISLVVLIFILTPIFQEMYQMNQQAVYLLWALAISLFLSSLKTIPSVLLERKLDFSKLVIPQIVETLLFNIVAVFLAWKGFGIASFTIAVLVRGIAGLITMYIVQPWKPGFSFSKSSIKPLFSYGIPYQMNTFLALIKDDGMTIFLGSILGTYNMGLLGWAQKWAAAPLRFFMDQVIRVTFPTFSRLQHDKEKLESAATKAILFINLAVFPGLTVLIIIAPILVQIIPRYDKWQPAVILLLVLCFNTAWAATTTPLTNLLNAIGKVGVTFKLMIMWTVLTWVVIPILAINFGVIGVAYGIAVIGLSSIIAIFIATRYVSINFLTSVGKPLLSALFMAAAMYITGLWLEVSTLKIIILLIVGVISYCFGLFILLGDEFAKDVKEIISILRGKKVTAE